MRIFTLKCITFISSQLWAEQNKSELHPHLWAEYGQPVTGAPFLWIPALFCPPLCTLPTDFFSTSILDDTCDHNSILIPSDLLQSHHETLFPISLCDSGLSWLPSLTAPLAWRGSLLAMGILLTPHQLLITTTKESHLQVLFQNNNSSLLRLYMAYNVRQLVGQQSSLLSVDNASVICPFQCFPGNMHFASSTLSSS